jgi:hypothetical protein
LDFGEVSPDLALRGTRLVEQFFSVLMAAIARAEKEVKTRRGAPPVPEEAMLLVQELGRIWLQFGPRGPKGPPAVTNSLKAGGFADFVITAFASPEFGFTPAQLKTAIRYHVTALRRATAAAARRRAS